jgi:hypothetical protein
VSQESVLSPLVYKHRASLENLKSRLGRIIGHTRRKLVDITPNCSAPMAEDGVERIREQYRI